MRVDPTQNVVVFELAREGHGPAAAEAPTLADDCVRQAWESVRHEHLARADEVTALYSEWEPSPADARFIAEHFPTAHITYSFRRPHPDDWDEAFDAARQLMEQNDGELLPVVWSHSSPQAEILDFLPHHSLVSEGLYVAIATVAPTPRGTIGMSHLTHNALRERGNPPLADLLALALENLRDGLRIEGERSELGDLVTMHRGTHSIAAAAVALPDFHTRLSEIVSDDRLIVGLPCQNHLLVTGASSGYVDHVKEATLSSPHPPDELTPSVLLVEHSGMHLIAERS